MCWVQINHPSNDLSNYYQLLVSVVFLAARISWYQVTEACHSRSPKNFFDGFSNEVIKYLDESKSLKNSD